MASKIVTCRISRLRAARGAAVFSSQMASSSALFHSITASTTQTVPLTSKKMRVMPFHEPFVLRKVLECAGPLALWWMNPRSKALSPQPSFDPSSTWARTFLDHAIACRLTL